MSSSRPEPPFCEGEISITPSSGWWVLRTSPTLYACLKREVFPKIHEFSAVSPFVGKKEDVESLILSWQARCDSLLVRSLGTPWLFSLSQTLPRALSFCQSAASPERSFVARDVLSIAPTSCSDVWSLIVEPTLFTQLKNGDFPLSGPYSQIDGSLAGIRNTISSWHAHISQYPDLLSASKQGGIASALAFCELRLAEHKAPVSPEGGSAVEERSLSVSLRLEVRYDPTASVWVGHCPAMNLTSQGTTLERAFLAVEEAVLLVIKHKQGAS